MKNLDPQQIKEDIIADIRTWSESGRARIEKFLRNIEQLNDAECDQDFVKQIVYIVAVLSFHLRFGGLKEQEIKLLKDIAEKLFEVISYKKMARSAFLLAELRLIQSQILSHTGEIWLAAWSQQVSINLAGKNTLPGGKDFQNFSMARKSLRLGHTRMAERLFIKAKIETQDQQLFDHIQINLLRLYRIKGDDSKRKLIELEIRQIPEQPAMAREVEWEQLCSQLRNDTDKLSEIFKLIKNGRSHYKPSYLLESFLWAYAVPTFKYHKKLPNLANLNRNKELDFKKYWHEYKIVEGLGSAYDSQIPLKNRWHRLELTLKGLNQVKSIDRVLLIWLSLSRWLARNKSYQLAALALEEYGGISLRLTNGQNQDCLGIAKDLYDKPWYLDSTVTEESCSRIG